MRYTAAAARDLKRHSNMAARIRAALTDYALSGARANMVTRLVGSSASRMRVGNFRVIFEDAHGEIVVTKIGPRGDIYD